MTIILKAMHVYLHLLTFVLIKSCIDLKWTKSKINVIIELVSSGMNRPDVLYGNVRCCK